MHKDMSGLWQLQQIDSAIAELEADKRALDDGTELRAQLEAAKSELVALESKHHEDATAQATLEANLEKTEAKRKSIMDKAYAGTISNPKELETLESEIASLGRQKDRYEDQLLVLFETVDGERQAVREQERTVESLEERLTATLATHESESARITAQVAELEKERQAALTGLEEASIDKYERIRSKHGNIGVALVSDGMCTACRVGLPVVQVTHLEREANFQQCESCKRLLWTNGE